MRRRLLTLSQARQLTAEELRRLAALGFLFPISGADGDDEGADSTEPEATVTDPEPESTPDPDEAPDDDVHVSKSEYERLRRIAADHAKARKQAEKAARDQAEKERRDAGNWEELLKERDEKAAELEAERDAARTELETTLRNARVQSAAVRLGFRDPADAARFLSEEDTVDDASTERALKRLAKSKAYLVNERKASGAVVNGETGALTVDDVKRMSAEEIIARRAEVNAVMAGSGGGR